MSVEPYWFPLLILLWHSRANLYLIFTDSHFSSRFTFFFPATRPKIPLPTHPTSAVTHLQLQPHGWLTAVYVVLLTVRLTADNSGHPYLSHCLFPDTTTKTTYLERWSSSQTWWGTPGTADLRAWGPPLPPQPSWPARLYQWRSKHTEEQNSIVIANLVNITPQQASWTPTHKDNTRNRNTDCAAFTLHSNTKPVSISVVCTEQQLAADRWGRCNDLCWNPPISSYLWSVSCNGWKQQQQQKKPF